MTLNNNTALSRRRFLRQATALAGVVATADFAQGARPKAKAKPARVVPKIGVAVIGCGGAGAPYPAMAASERLVALVDVDEQKLGDAVRRAAAAGANPRTFFDYRRMLDECDTQIDAVLIATPDHHHAPAALRAIALGKHVFLQKPLAYSLHEARAVKLAARDHMVVTQMANQGHSGEGYRLLCEYIWAGAIGNVREVHSMMERNYGGSGSRPPAQSTPPGLHWDEWIGPAPFREYHPGLHPAGWRAWLNFGNGALGDMGCHALDGAFWALKLHQANTFTVECLAQRGGSAEMFPQNNTVRWEFPERGTMPPVKVFAYDCEWPPFIQELERKLAERFRGGTLYIGERGCMFTDTFGDGPRVLPPEEHEAVPKPKKIFERPKKATLGDYYVLGDFFTACRGKPPASSSFEMAGPLTEMVLTGVLAIRAGVGKKIEWDVDALQCVNRPEVNRWVKREYRKGWEVV